MRRRELMMGDGILPSGYTRLTWLTNNGDSYFNSGVQRSDNTSQLIDIETTVRFNEGYSKYGLMGSDYGCYFGIRNDSWVNDTTSQTQFKIQRGIAYHVFMYRNDVTTQTLYINEIPILTTQRTLSGSRNVFVFNIGYYEAGTGYQLVCSLGRTKIWKARELVRDLVPCINPNSIYGMYDLVEKNFYTSSDLPFSGEI